MGREGVVGLGGGGGRQDMATGQRPAEIKQTTGNSSVRGKAGPGE